MTEHELVAPDDDGGEVLVPGLALTPKEELFVRAFCDVESETFGRAVKSAAVAKYVEPRNAAWKLRRRPRIIARIAEYAKVVRVEIGKVLSDLEHTRLLALAAGDWSTATRCSELQGKHLAMFTDKVAVDDTYVHVYDERAAVEARRITAVLLLNPDLGLPPDVPQLPAAIEAQGPPAEPARATPEQLQALRTPQQEGK